MDMFSTCNSKMILIPEELKGEKFWQHLLNTLYSLGMTEHEATQLVEHIITKMKKH